MTTIDERYLLPAEPAEGWEEWEPPAENPGADAVAEADRAQAEQMAEWLAGVSRRRAQVGSLVQARIDELENRLAVLRDRAAEIDAPLARRAAYLEGWLGQYAIRERERSGGRVKSVKLLYATAATSETGGGWQVDDEDALPWFMANHPDLVEAKPRVMVADAKRVPGWTVKDGRVITPDGEVVPGVSVAAKVIKPKVSVVDTGEA